jgi:uncharacterized membrane protein
VSAEQKSMSIFKKLILLIFPVIPALLFILIIGYFNLLEYNSYQYTQFDLGVGYRTLYNFHVTYHLYNWPVPVIETPQTFSKLIYIPLSFTLYIYNSPFTLLLDQIVFIASGGVAVFYISKEIIGNSKISMIIEIIYFLYPSTYGFMTQGGNLMVFFEPLLLISYYFYIRNRNMIASVFIALASITDPIAPIILIVFLALPCLNKLLALVKTKIRPSNKAEIRTSLTINKEQVWHILFFAIPSLFFLMSLKLYGLSNLYSDARLGNLSTALSSSSGSIFQTISENFTSKLSFLNTVIEPLLYLPFLSIYSLPILFYLLFAWYSNETIYYDILTRQYPYLFVGFLFISLVQVLKGLLHNHGVVKKIAILLIVSGLVSFALHSPFSVGNFQNGNINSEITATSLDKNLTNAFSLIPMNASVLVQNNIVQLDNRQQIYFPGYYNDQLVQYAVFAPPSPGGLEAKAPYARFSPSLENQFANNASYGLYVRLGNVEIYKLHFVGSPVMFSKETFSGESSFLAKKTTSYMNISFSTESIELSPGPYNLTFSEKVSSNSTFAPKNVSGKLSLLVNGGNSSISNCSLFESLSFNNELTFSGHFMIRNFESYYIGLGITIARPSNFTFIGSPNFTIVSIFSN